MSAPHLRHFNALFARLARMIGTRDGRDQFLRAGFERAREGRLLTRVRHRRRHGIETAASFEQQLVLSVPVV
jgi:hypothetical protein